VSRVAGGALIGVEGAAVEVEVRIGAQLPRIDIVGLPEASVRESASRVRAAIASLGVTFPQGRIVVNLAPAALRKSGAGLDLAIAMGILLAGGLLDEELAVAETIPGAPSQLERTAFVGELALDGRLRGVPGVLALVLALRDAGFDRVVVPAASAPSAALAPDVEVIGAGDLAAVVGHFRGVEPLAPWIDESPLLAAERAGESAAHGCLREVRGQDRAKRALEIAAAGGHGLLLYGPPGAGKTMLARRLPGLLPPLAPDEVLAATRIHGAAGLLPESERAITARPFRAPHHSASAAGLLGGGQPPRPGEVSLAHCGVLLLDELPEFERRVREALRLVLEERSVTLARANFSCRFPADFMLVCAANPCPCGWYRSSQRDCRCEEAHIARYRQRISGPLLDRIDLHTWVPMLPWRELERGAAGPSSAEVRERVMAARKRQHARGVPDNARMPDRALDALVAATEPARALLGRAVDQLGLSARAARRVLRVARTIADLAREDVVGPGSVAEAIDYRGEDGAPGA
jgi:magnesium chelatase family protein